MQKVEVHWQDAAFEMGTHTKEEILTFEPIDMLTVGILVQKTKQCIFVASETCGDNSYRNIFIIPTAYVTKIVEF